MARLLKRDYEDEELLEMTKELLERTETDRKGCYSSGELQKNSILQKYYRQLASEYARRVKQKKESTNINLFS